MEIKKSKTNSKNQDIQLCNIKKINRFRIVDYSIDTIGLILGLIAIFLLIYLTLKYQNDLINYKIAESSFKNIIYGIIGLIGYISIISYHHHKSKSDKCYEIIFHEPFKISLFSINPNKLSFYDQKFNKYIKTLPKAEELGIINSRLSEEDKEDLEHTYTMMQYLIYMGLCTIGYFGIQAIVILLLGKPLFQVVVFDVYAYFISGAIVEELLFRGFLTTLFQYILSNTIIKHDKRIEKKEIYIINIISALCSGLVFFLFHTRYFSDITASTITIVIGFYQGLWFLYTKSLLVVMVSHIIGNALSAGSLIEQLGL